MIKLKNKYITLSTLDRLYHCPNPIIGLTGGIATGKSTVSKMMRDEGVWVISADQLIHNLYAEQVVLNQVNLLCPESIKEGKINFSTLRKSFFNTPKIKRELETLLYSNLPRVFIESLPKDEDQVIIYDVPLLFEKKLEGFFDQIITVVITEDIQLQRLEQRDGNDFETHKNILENQWPLFEKKAKSNFVIENNGGLEELKTKVSHIRKELFILQ